MKLPQNKWLLIVFLNLIWWALPLGFWYELFKNLSLYAPDPNADSLGIIIFPLFGLWFVLWIGLNIVLFIKSRFYPAGASVLVWNSKAKIQSLLFTVTCIAFLLLYISMIFSQVRFDQEHQVVSWGIYLPLLLYSIASVYFRTLLVAPECAER